MLETKDITAPRIDGTEYVKRTITLADEESTIDININGEDIKKVEYEANMVVKFKRVKISGTNGNKMLLFMKDSIMQMVPNDTANNSTNGLMATTSEMAKAIENIDQQPLMLATKQNLLEAINQLVNTTEDLKIEITKTVMEGESLFIINKIDTIIKTEETGSLNSEATPKKDKKRQRSPVPTTSRATRPRRK